MFIKMAAGLAAAVFSLGGLAQAQPATAPLGVSPAPPPASPEALTAAHAYADQLIATSNGGDLFENISLHGTPVVRHRRSGMTCAFSDKRADHVGDRVYVLPSKLPRGDDVGCGMHIAGFTVSLYATRFAQTPTLQDAMGKYYAEVLRVHPQAQRYTGEHVELTSAKGAPIPPTLSARFVIEDNGVKQYSVLKVGVMNGWVIEARATGPLDQAMLGDVLATGEIITALGHMAQNAAPAGEAQH